MKYSKKSLEQLNTCDKRLQDLFNEVIKYVDVSIICGFRDKAKQNEAFKNGNSKLKWPQSKHNSFPSKALDFMPWPNDKNEDYIYIAGIIVGIALKMKIPIRYGCDWNYNFRTSDEKFRDLGHIELK